MTFLSELRDRTLGMAREFGSLEGADAYRRTGQSPVPAEVGRLTTKARFLNSAVLEGANAAALQTAIDTWLKAAKEADFVSIHPLHTANGYSVLILYTET